MSSKEKSVNRIAHENKEASAVSAETLRDGGYQGENCDSPLDCKQKASLFAPQLIQEAIPASAGMAGEAQEAFNAAKFSLAVLLCCGILLLLLLSAFVHAILWQLVILCIYCLVASLWIIYKIRRAYRIAQRGISHEAH